MTEISISQLVNQVDQSNFTLYVEWQNIGFKIILLRSSMVPLIGEMHTENANYFLRHLGESFDIYLEKTKCAFSGENMDIQFFLQDNTFTWKQQNILTRGKITVNPLSNILILSDTLKYILECYQTCKKRMITLEQENGYLSDTNAKLNVNIEEVVKIKADMEKDLCNKFLLLLNSKKQKIRELQEVLNKKQPKSVYDESTDESEQSDTEDKSVQETSIMFMRKKRKTNSQDEQKDQPKISKKDFTRSTNFSSESSSPEPSTSKVKSIQNADIQRTKKLELNISEEESEDDLFSQ